MFILGISTITYAQNLSKGLIEQENRTIDSVKVNLWATYYYIPTVIHNKNGINLLDSNEKNTGFKLSSTDWCKASIEGTVYIIKDNKTFVLNYAGRSKTIQFDCRTCPKYKNYDGYLKTGQVLWKHSAGFGKGVQNLNLVPFKSIAVDSSKIPYGTVLYIPKAKNITYKDIDGITKKHDGYFYASDAGSKIIGNHIDIFLGPETINPFIFATSNQHKTFEAYIIENNAIKTKLESLHK